MHSIKEKLPDFTDHLCPARDGCNMAGRPRKVRKCFRQMKPWIIYVEVAFLSCCCAFTGCSTWGYNTRSGEKIYPPVRYEHVRIFHKPPTQDYTEIGDVSAIGGAFATTTENVRKMQKMAAKLGADAIIVTQETKALYLRTNATAIKFK